MIQIQLCSTAAETCMLPSIRVLGVTASCVEEWQCLLHGEFVSFTWGVRSKY